MNTQTESIGIRIVQAARLAVMAHLAADERQANAPTQHADNDPPRILRFPQPDDAPRFPPFNNRRRAA
jgi:hypothetical protein